MMHTDLYHKLGVVILSVENDDATRVALKGAFRSVKTYQHKCAKRVFSLRRQLSTLDPTCGIF